MEALRIRAAAGEDLNQLQQDAYKHLHILVPPPPVNVIPLQRRVLQGDEAKAYDLKAGELSEVLDLPAAFAIIKMESKEPVAIAAVRQALKDYPEAPRLGGHDPAGKVFQVGGALDSLRKIIDVKPAPTIPGALTS